MVDQNQKSGTNVLASDLIPGQDTNVCSLFLAFEGKCSPALSYSHATKRNQDSIKPSNPIKENEQAY